MQSVHTARDDWARANDAAHQILEPALKSGEAQKTNLVQVMERVKSTFLRIATFKGPGAGHEFLKKLARTTTMGGDRSCINEPLTVQKQLVEKLDILFPDFLLMQQMDKDIDAAKAEFEGTNEQK